MKFCTKKNISCVLIVLLLNLCGCSALHEGEKESIGESLSNHRKNTFETKDKLLSDEEKEKESTEDTEPIIDKKKDDVSVTLEKDRVIQEQSFNVNLNDFGEVKFVSYEPDHKIDFDDVSFYLLKDDQVIYEFPQYCEDNNTNNYVGLFDSVAAVGFHDLNRDGLNDIVVIIDYITGAGPQGMEPRPTVRIFLAKDKEFYIAEDMMNDIADDMESKEITIKNVYDYVENKIDTEN